MEKEKLKYLDIKRTFIGPQINKSLKIAIAITVILVIGMLFFAKFFLD
jgi:O-antigen/teichoic acid export membrane protein